VEYTRPPTPPSFTERPPHPSRPVLNAWVAGALALLVATLLLLLLRERLDKAHVALVYLLVVLGGSAAGGRTLGIVLSGAAFVAFNFLFLPPYHTLVIADPFDWLVLIAFLVTGIVAAQLLYRAQREAALARRRTMEVDRLAALGAETLSAGRADAALGAIARVIRETLDVGDCEIYVLLEAVPSLAEAKAAGTTQSTRTAPPPSVQLAARASTSRVATDAHENPPGADGTVPVLQHEIPPLVTVVAHNGHATAERADGTSRILAHSGSRHLTAGLSNDLGDIRALLLPLTVHQRAVGVLRLSDPRAVRLDPTRQRYLEALAYYAALGVERLRLAAEAERAEALREADRLKDALIATVSHDLRTPLTTIRGLAHDIATGDGGDERALMIEEEVDRLNRFVADLLDLSRLNAGGVPLHLEVNAAEDLMGAALQRVLGVSADHEIRATLDPEVPILFGRFDLGQSIRILANLLENACKYTPTGAPVDFTMRREPAPPDGSMTGDVLAFRVADRGAGVPDAEASRIFAPFYRPAGAPPDVGSAGLGLAIARGLAEAQGGSLTYERRPGGGSVFTLRLPAVDIDALDAL